MSTLADAVRELLYGNGDLKAQADRLTEALAKEDGCRPKSPTKLHLLVEEVVTQDPDFYTHLSGDEWNK